MVLALALTAVAVAASIAAMVLRPSPPAPKPPPGLEAGKREAEAIYREARAIAEAEAKAKAELREAELQVAEEMMNVLESYPEPSSDVEELGGELEAGGTGTSVPEVGEKANGARDVFSRDVYTRPTKAGEAQKGLQDPKEN